MIPEGEYTITDDSIIYDSYRKFEMPLEYNPQPNDTPVERAHKIHDATHRIYQDDTADIAKIGPYRMARAAMYLNQYGEHSMYPSDKIFEKLAKANAERPGQPDYTEIGESNSLLLTDANLRNAGSRIGNYVFALDGETPVGLSLGTYDEVKIYGEMPYTGESGSRRAATDLGGMADWSTDSSSCGDNRDGLDLGAVMGRMGEYGNNIVLDEGEQANGVPM